MTTFVTSLDMRPKWRRRPDDVPAMRRRLQLLAPARELLQRPARERVRQRGDGVLRQLHGRVVPRLRRALEAEAGRAATLLARDRLQAGRACPARHLGG